MKHAFHILLSIYILALTVLPCVDLEVGSTCHDTEIAASTDGQGQQDLDHCSPFCDCCCCGLPMMTGVSHFSFQIEAVTLERLGFHHYYIPVHYYSLPWNPPEVA